MWCILAIMLCISLFIAVTGLTGQHQLNVVRKGKLCGFEFSIPTGTIIEKNFDDFIMLWKWKNLSRINRKVQWMFHCRSNSRRTSRISDLKDDAHEQNEVIINPKKIKIHYDVVALVYTKSRIAQGKKIVSVEAYFATRDLEFQFYAIPDNSDNSIRLEDMQSVLTEMVTLLEEGRFQNEVETTITEAEYRLRLYLFTALFSILVIVIMIFIVRFIIKKG